MKNLTKSNFLAYLDAPMHLWADDNVKFEKPLSAYDQHLMADGYKVEKLAKKHLEQLFLNQPNNKLIWQKTYIDKNYESKTDALVHKIDTDTYDIYEIKSSNTAKKINLYDATFQFLVLNKQIKIDKVYILHLNKEYIRFGELNIQSLFVAEDVTDKIDKLKIEVDIEREKALRVINTEDHSKIQPCYNIKACRCMSLCHNNLPSFSIFNIPHLSKKKKQALLDMDVVQAQDIPDNFKLSYKQNLVKKVAKTNQPIIDKKAINHELQRLTFPLYFLDYETYNSAIPLFNGYHSQQQMVFQYSLHILEHPDSELKHTEHLSINQSEPALPLIEKMKKDIGDTGSILVWNKTFETSRNKEMAEIYPDHSEFLLQLNDRIYDLADSIKEGFYVHPRFKGSWRIKAVLPVMVPSLTYQTLDVKQGDEAMIAWWNLVHDKQNTDKDQLAKSLIEYCKLDTLAMVEIYKKFIEIHNQLEN